MKLSSLGILRLFFSGLNKKLTAGQQIVLSLNNEKHFILSLNAFMCPRLFIFWVNKAFLTLSAKRGGQGQNKSVQMNFSFESCGTTWNEQQ